MRSFYLYETHEKEIVTVKPNFNGTFELKGHKGSFLQHVNEQVDENEYEAFKRRYDLRTQEELGQDDIWTYIGEG